MSTGNPGIYHWKLGDVALARLCQKAYARVRVVKDEKGLFYDDKVLGISGNEDGSITVTKELCYYVETCRTNHRFWLPYTSLHLAERSRPFYGTEKVPTNKVVKTEVSPNKTPAMPRKRKIKEEHIVPLDVKLNMNKEPDLNTTYDIRHMPLKQGKYENAFKEFVRRGKEMLFDQYFELLKTNADENKDALNYLMHVNASTEDKFELVTKSIVTEKEIENYFHQCWRYNFVLKQSSMDSGREMADCTNSKSPIKEAVTVHTPWCIVCGKGDNKLRDCINCPAAFHLPCRREWLLTVIHRKNPPKKAPKPVTLVEKILSSTRTKCTVRKDKENVEICPSCMWGPKVGYDDIVWHKLGPCPWWPARILTPGEVPSCLLGRTHSPHDWPLRYYGTLNHSWAASCRTCLFLPSHTGALAAKESELKEAVMDANDDYIRVYLT